MSQKNSKKACLNKCTPNTPNTNIKEIEAIAMEIENIKNMDIIIEEIAAKAASEAVIPEKEEISLKIGIEGMKK
jgi:hemoglobin-like flavoprotein